MASISTTFIPKHMYFPVSRNVCRISHLIVANDCSQTNSPQFTEDHQKQILGIKDTLEDNSLYKKETENMWEEHHQESLCSALYILCSVNCLLSQVRFVAFLICIPQIVNYIDSATSELCKNILHIEYACTYGPNADQLCFSIGLKSMKRLSRKHCDHV